MSRRIIVVDDSRVVHAQMIKLLEGTDYEIVECCQDGESAVRAYKKHKPDLVTMDIIMPGMDGLETAKKILGQCPDAKIVMVTSLAYDDTIEDAKKIGAKGFIFKPFDKEAMLKVLDSVFQEEG